MFPPKEHPNSKIREFFVELAGSKPKSVPQASKVSGLE